MDKDYTQNVMGAACEFLKRADLKGVEVPDYSEVWNFLSAIGTGDFVVLSTDEYETLVSDSQRMDSDPGDPPAKVGGGAWKV